jgi:hypothetical protein
LRLAAETVVEFHILANNGLTEARSRPLAGSGGSTSHQVTEADLSDAFQDRENTFEKQFAHDEDLRFKAVARRNKALALWVAGMKKLPAADAEKYADDFVGAQVGKSDADVAAALKADLAYGDIDLSDHRLGKKIDEEMVAAVASVRAGR